MTRVDFYVLEDGADDARERFACRLADKAWRLKHSVYLHAASPAAAQHLDSLLWTWSDGSFLPHVLQSPDLDPDLASATQVRIGAGEEPGFEAALLVNLAQQVPLFFSRFERVAEIVGPGDSERASARDRFRFYRDRGYTLETHQIGRRSA
jgi:DNA polymerase III subunit chi